ncbi:MAG: glycosyltransferase family 4 protein [Phycisphaerae bacterium]
MNIALVIERFDPLRGGRETSTAQIAEELSRRGHTVTVLCQQGRTDLEFAEVLPLGRTGFSRTGRLQTFIEQVELTLAGRSFDIVHSMLPVPGADVYQLRGGTVPGQREAALRQSGPIELAVRKVTDRLNFHRAAMGALETQVISDPETLCLPVSEMIQRELVEHYGRTDGVRTIYNAVDLPDISPEKRRELREQKRAELHVGPDDLIFLTLATNLELKGIEHAITSFGQWRRLQPEYGKSRLVIVGKDSPIVYERWADRKECRFFVDFIPPTPDVWPYYAAADVVMLLSWYDPCSRVVLEATRWGIPSITTVCNGASEILHGAGCVVQSPSRVDEVVNSMALLSDASLRAEWSEKLLTFSDELAMTRHVDQLEEAYKEVPGRS